MSKGHLALKKATISLENDIHSFFFLSLTFITINVRHIQCLRVVIFKKYRKFEVFHKIVSSSTNFLFLEIENNQHSNQYVLIWSIFFKFSVQEYSRHHIIVWMEYQPVFYGNIPIHFLLLQVRTLNQINVARYFFTLSGQWSCTYICKYVHFNVFTYVGTTKIWPKIILSFSGLIFALRKVRDNFSRETNPLAKSLLRFRMSNSKPKS